MFSKLFKKERKTPLKTIQSNSSYSLKNNESSKEEEHILYPFISNLDSKTITKNNLVIPFLYHHETEKPKVVVSLVTYNNKDLGIVNSTKMEQDDLKPLVVTANENIAKLVLDFAPQRVFNNEVINVEPHLLTSEKVLDAKFMQQMQDTLKTSSILVSIPRRGRLMICNQNANEEIKSKFLNYHYALYMDKTHESEQLTEDLLVFKDGELENILYLKQ